MNNSPTPSETPVKPRTALIVDDEPYIREIFRIALEMIGYECIEAEDGKQALELLAGQTYTLMLLDLQMPHVDGMTVLKTVRQMFLHEKMKIVVITAKAPMATGTIYAIADRVLFKPIMMDDLLEFAGRGKPRSAFTQS